MSQTKIRGIAGLGLIVIYSVIMMATNGVAADWAWLLLATALVLLGTAARSMVASKSRHEG